MAGRQVLLGASGTFDARGHVGAVEDSQHVCSREVEVLRGRRNKKLLQAGTQLLEAGVGPQRRRSSQELADGWPRHDEDHHRAGMGLVYRKHARRGAQVTQDAERDVRSHRDLLSVPPAVDGGLDRGRRSRSGL